MPLEVLERTRCQTVTVTAFEGLADDLFMLWCYAPALARTAPGQFVHVRCEGSHLRRPFSVFAVRGDHVALLIRVKGAGTRWLLDRRPGERIDVLGPLGRPFTKPSRHDRLLLVGGGVGVAPLAHFIDTYAPTAFALLGFQDAAHAAALDAFGAVPTEIYTDDGSAGRQGRVTAGLASAIARFRPTRVLACGPDPMMRAVAETAAAGDLPCEVSVERPMGCGIGVCLGCVVPVKAGAQGTAYARACCEGPIFDAAEVRW